MPFADVARRLAAMTLITGASAVFLIAGYSGRADACVGDCSGNGVVTVNDVVECVNIALGTTDLSMCSACSVDGRSVGISDLIAAVNSVLSGCQSPTTTSTATATSTVSRTATRTAAPTNTATTTVTSPATATVTNVPTATVTVTSTESPTGTPTGTTEATVTETPTGTPTGTAEATTTDTPTETPTGMPTGTSAATGTPTPTVTPSGPSVGVAHGSVGQVYVTDASPGTQLDLLNPGGGVVQTGTTDSVGSLIFRCTADLGCVSLPAGPGYTVALTANHQVVSGPVTVTAWDDPPDPSFYASQVIGPQKQSDCDFNLFTELRTCAQYGYLYTRDGTRLAYTVYLPDSPENGPYPTVVEYSGYTPGDPGNPQPSSLLAIAEKYAVVGVNMRGTGCSGGAYDFFEPLQSTDGYDIIEAVAQQPWTLKDQSGNAHIGMVGISFPGITQLFVAQLQPPHLAAIAPLSVISDTGRGTLFPGGILNDGFAVSWATDRQDDAMPYPAGQPWSVDRINNGDQTCLANQKLRRQAPDIMEMIQDNQYYVPAVDDPLTPATFVNKINVPIFLAGAWQDEQVGGYVATMLDKFDPSNTKAHFTLVNGNHSEPLTPAIFARWLEFLSFYVRHEIPHANATDQLVMTIGVANQAPFRHTTPGDPQYLPDCAFTLPADRFKNDTDYDTALAKFESDPRIRVLFDNGSGDLSSICPPGTPAYPGAPVPAFEAGFDAWPIPSTTATRWYFGKGDVGTDGTLTTIPPSDQDAADAFSYDNENAHTTDLQAGYGGDDTWLPQPPWNWQPLTDGKAVAYTTPPLDHDVVMIGSGSVDVWFKANAPDVDLQFTLTEIRPDQGDGVKEVYVQNGWGRASRRKLDPDLSTELRPIATGTEADVEFLDPDGDYVFGRAELFPFAHVFRAGSRIRLSIERPGGDRPLWTFQAVTVPSTVDIARSAVHPSSVVLPVIPGVTVPASALLPPCPSLRGQPCRDYAPLTNMSATP